MNKAILSRVVRNGTCLEWTGAIRSGYGCLKVGEKIVSAHRYSYEIHIGKIPTGMMVCHRCDNKKCINPNHLFLGTAKDNVRDAIQKGRHHTPIGYQFKKGIDNPNSKLREGQKEEIIRMRKNGMELREIAKLFGIDHSRVWQITH